MTTTGCSNDSTIQEVKEFHHDFRGKPLPAEFGLFQVNDDKLVQIEPEGLRIRMLRPFTSPGYGIGVRTNFGFKGDFDVTVAFELLQMDMPPASPKAGPASIGVTLFLVPVHGGINAATAMDRFIQVDDIRLVKANNRGRPLFVSSTVGLANSPIGQGALFGAFGLILGKTRDTNGIRWWAKDPPKYVNQAVPCDNIVCRLRMARNGGIVQYLWAPGTQGDNFQRIGQSEWRFEEVEHVRMTSFMNRSPVSTDVRLLDFQIRADQLINLGIFAPEKGGLAKALVIGMAFTMLMALVAWLFFRRRRKDDSVEIA